MKRWKTFLILPVAMAVAVLCTGLSATACDIAVVAAKASSTGRPLIWKVRDNGLDWQQEVAAYKRSENRVNPAAGGSIRVIDRTRGTAAQSGGVNEAGFAITNTTVYQESPIHEYLASANLNIMSVSLKECVTVGDFDAYIAEWHLRGENGTRILSGNFVVIDAFGGAALYELTTGDSPTDVFAYGGRVKVHRIDANTGFVTNEDGALIGNAGEIGYLTDYRTGSRVQVMNLYREIINAEYRLNADRSAIIDSQGNVVDTGERFPGFVNRTNSSFWVHLNDDTPREDRATAMMEALRQQGNLNHRTMLQQVSKDIDIEQYNLASYPNLSNLDPGSATQQSTFHTISRYSTNLAFVVDGTEPGGDPRLSTMWINLGEPVIGVATPYWPAANEVPDEAWADALLFGRYNLDLTPTCFLNKTIEAQRQNLYDNNGGDGLTPPPPEINDRLLLDLRGVDWFFQPYEDAWDEFEGALIDWHMAYMDYMSANDTSDKTIDLYHLSQIVSWTVPLEDEIIERTEAYLAAMRADTSRITEDNLLDFSEYCATFMYDNYRNASATYRSWEFETPWDEKDGSGSSGGWLDWLRRWFGP